MRKITASSSSVFLGILLAVLVCVICKSAAGDHTADVPINTTGDFKPDPGGAGPFDRDLMMTGTKPPQTVHPKRAKALQGVAQAQLQPVDNDIDISDTLPAVKVAGATAVLPGKPDILICVTGIYVQPKVAAAGAVGGKAKLPTPNTWDARYARHSLVISYMGGQDPTDATKECEKVLAGNYILKGYVLKCVCQGVPANTPVTWTFTKAGGGATNVGSFFNGFAWSDYATGIAKGTATTLYWAPDTNGLITDQYTITASWAGGPQGGVTRTLASRTLAPDDPDARDYFNEDVDMLQRALIQIRFLNCGRLVQYTIGQYQQAKRANSSELYLRDGQWKTKTWAPVANEVFNLGHFSGSGTTHSLDLPVLQRLWGEYAKITTLGLQATALKASNPPVEPWYLAARQAAAQDAGLVPPQGSYAAEDVLDAIFKKESFRTHRATVQAPLYWSEVTVGTLDKPWWYTTTDTGWGQVKLNAADSVLAWNPGKNWNLYDSDGNMRISAALLKKMLENITVAGPHAQLWHAINKYKMGAAAYGNNGTLAPKDVRAKGVGSYADQVFTGAGWPLPQESTE